MTIAGIPATVGEFYDHRDSKGVRYFRNLTDALAVRDHLRVSGYPDARVVPYTMGDAVQYYRSGPYYPETPDPASRWNPYPAL